MVCVVGCVDGEGMVGGDEMGGNNAGEGGVVDAGNIGPVEVEWSHSVLQNIPGGDSVILQGQSIPGLTECPNVNLVVAEVRYNADQDEDVLRLFSGAEMLEGHTTDRFVAN